MPGTNEEFEDWVAKEAGDYVESRLNAPPQEPPRDYDIVDVLQSSQANRPYVKLHASIDRLRKLRRLAAPDTIIASEKRLLHEHFLRVLSLDNVPIADPPTD